MSTHSAAAGRRRPSPAYAVGGGGRTPGAAGQRAPLARFAIERAVYAALPATATLPRLDRYSDRSLRRMARALDRRADLGVRTGEAAMVVVGLVALAYVLISPPSTLPGLLLTLVLVAALVVTSAVVGLAVGHGVARLRCAYLLRRLERDSNRAL